MTVPSPVHAEDLDWWPVADEGTAGSVRRAATTLGRELVLPAERVDQLAIVAAELVSNLHRHAADGVVHLRALRSGESVGVELVGMDSGPGMADVAASARDGYSTAGSLGIGLGAIGRLATHVDAYSRVGAGTVIAAAVWGGPAPEAVAAAGLVRPIGGEQVSGDGYGLRLVDGRLQVMLCDALGHGQLAHATSKTLTGLFRDAPALRPAGILEHLQHVGAHTRGAVAAVVEFDPDGTGVTCASLGNIAGWVVGPMGRRGITAQPGFIGDRQKRTVREYAYPAGPGAVVVLHTDGVTDKWDLATYPGLLGRSPVVVAGTLLRDAGVRRDDAGVLVVPVPGPP